MAAFDYTRAPAASHGLFARIGAFVSDAFGIVAAWRDAEATRRSLHGLSDRELEDIGLVRGDIDDVATGTMHRF